MRPPNIFARRNNQIPSLSCLNKFLCVAHLLGSFYGRIYTWKHFLMCKFCYHSRTCSGTLIRYLGASSELMNCGIWATWTVLYLFYPKWPKPKRIRIVQINSTLLEVQFPSPRAFFIVNSEGEVWGEERVKFYLLVIKFHLNDNWHLVQ